MTDLHAPPQYPIAKHTPEMKLPRCRGDFNYYYYSPSSLLRSYTFFVSGKAARFEESSHPRTLSGHLIPIRYFSLLSCSSLSWASCFYPSLPPSLLLALPTTSLTVELSPALSYFLAVPPFSQSPSEYVVFVSTAGCVAFIIHSYADS